GGHDHDVANICGVVSKDKDVTQWSEPFVVKKNDARLTTMIASLVRLGTAGKTALRAIQHGTGLTPGEALDSLGVSYGSISPELDALAEFLGTLDLVSLPSTLDSATSRDGEAVFERSGCAECHGAPLYTDLLLHDVGTGDPALEKNSHGRGTMFDTPSLRGINLTAPYFHDGSAPNLRAVFDETASSGLAHAVGGQLNDEDMDLLIAFVRSL
ncbi:MAG: di-heme oxidoredictase family protein, partial [Dehalococcoidia bacterium]|nr:di-heme oxidoredictase family protein [Dehalococcoidia bacterium]